MVRRGFLWFAVVFCGSPWFFVVCRCFFVFLQSQSRGFEWFAVVFCGLSSLFWFFAIFCNSRVVVFSGSPWFFVVCRRFFFVLFFLIFRGNPMPWLKVVRRGFLWFAVVFCAAPPHFFWWWRGICRRAPTIFLVAALGFSGKFSLENIGKPRATWFFQ